MEIASSSFITFFVRILKKLLPLWRDEAIVNIEVETPFSGDSPDFFVSLSNNDIGLFRFAVSSSSKTEVELLEVQLDYKSPLQIFDPEKRGFFDNVLSNRNELPFRIRWKGEELIGAKLKQLFAVAIFIPKEHPESNISFTLLTRKKHKILGFIDSGKTQQTVVSRSIKRTTERLLGIKIDPGWSLSSPQPFIVEGMMTANSGGENGVNVIVHEVMKDGYVKSSSVNVPSSKSETI